MCEDVNDYRGSRKCASNFNFIKSSFKYFKGKQKKKSEKSTVKKRIEKGVREEISGCRKGCVLRTMNFDRFSHTQKIHAENVILMASPLSTPFSYRSIDFPVEEILSH